MKNVIKSLGFMCLLGGAEASLAAPSTQQICDQMGAYGREVWNMFEQGYTYSELSARAKKQAGSNKTAEEVLGLAVSLVYQADADSAGEARKYVYLNCKRLLG